MLGECEDEEEWQKAWDDVKQCELDPRRVGQARAIQMEYVRKSNLYNKLPRRVCYARTGKPPLKSMWLDSNKGDELNPN
jgi:hypothetical protein